jgi:exosome complex component CSL4
MDDNDESTHTMVIPGTIVGRTQDYVPGDGVYEKDGSIIASLVGVPHVSDMESELHGISSTRKVLNIYPRKLKASDVIISEGKIVLCQVTRVLVNQINVDIIAIGRIELPYPSKGVIRREDVQSSGTDTLVMSDYFQVSDILKAEVVSLGDRKHYYLGCAKDHLGVCFSKSSNSKTI